MSFNRIFSSCACIVASLMIATPSWGQSTVVIDFDPLTMATPGWFSSGGGTTGAIEPPTPADTGGGTGNAMRITKPAGQDWWAGGELIGVPQILGNAGPQTITARVYTDNAEDITLNVEFVQGAPGNAYPPNETVVVGWQTLTWTITALDPGNTYNRIIIRPNSGDGGSETVIDGTYFLDNISYTQLDTPDPVTPYSQDFEPPMPLGSVTGNTGLSDDAWKYFVNVFGPSGEAPPLYNYNGDVPNNFTSFANVAEMQGGPGQGDQQLTVFSDYGNADHTNSSGNRIEVNVFQQPPNLNSADVGNTYYLRFDAKRGNIGGATTAAAFIKTLDPNNGFALTNNPVVPTTDLPTTWGTYCTSLLIDAGLDGQILQFGFTNTASNNEDSGVFYDNVSFGADTSGFTDTDLDGVFDCADPDDDNDGILDIYDSEPLVASNNCTGGDVDNGLLQGATIADAQICAANETVTVDSTTTVTAPDGDLHVISKQIGVADFAVQGGKATFTNDSCEGPGCPTPPPVCSTGVLNTNGGFETGDFTGTVQFENSGTQAISTVMPRTGTYSANLSVPNPTSDTVLKFANLDPGCFSENDLIYIKFYMRGTVGPGGVGFAEFFSELSGGGTSKAEILFGGGPIFPNGGDANAWVEFSTTATTGSDTSGGVTLQLKAASGASNADLFFDDVCVSVTPCP